MKLSEHGMNGSAIQSNRASVLARIPPNRLAEILDFAEDGIITVDAGRAIVLFNNGAAKLFGYTREEVAGKSLELLIPTRYSSSHVESFRSFARAAETARGMGTRREVSGRRKDGSEFPAEVSISKFATEEGPLFTAIVRDVTERKRYEAAETELERLRTRARLADADAEILRTAEQRERALIELQAKTDELKATTQQLWHAARLAGVGELAASIAHGLNNPLGTVALRIEGLLAKTAPDDPRRRALEVVEQEVERMAGLVSNLLQFSRAGRNQVSTVDVTDEILKTVDLVGHHLRKRRIGVERDFAPDVPIIHADRQQLRQVFLNLLTNAVDAMPDGGRLTIAVRLGGLPSGCPAISIDLSDTGTGIAPELVSRVFDPFFTTKDEGHGTGLGLAICRRIIQQHHGTLEIESRIGVGTNVRITLPVSPDTNVTGLHTP